MFVEISNRLKRAEKVVFVTGAGISQESGIPTFRGNDGLWKKYDPMKLATIEAFHKDPKLVWEWYEERRQNIFAANPNSGHIAIAELEKYKQVSVLTQNIDGLHQRARSSQVYELHGSIITIKCTKCNFKDKIMSSFSQLPPFCKCGNMLRPDVVWFGESLPHDIWQSAIEEASSCDVMFIVGTSLTVSPANFLPAYAKQNGATLIEVNIAQTPMSSSMDISIRSSAAKALPDFIGAIL